MGRILGIPYKGRDVLDCSSTVFLEMRKNFSKLKHSQLKQYMQEMQMEDASSSLKFRQYFLLFLLGCFLCPTTNVYPASRHLSATIDVENADQYNWAKFVLQWLADEVYQFKGHINTGREEEERKKTRIGGCLFLLMVSF